MARMAGVSRVAFTTTQLPSTSPLATSSLTPLAPLAPTRLPARAFSAEVPPIQERIQAMVDESKVVVFMKGVPEAPQCGFSNAVCQILRMHDVNFQGHNVLADEEPRRPSADSATPSARYSGCTMSTSRGTMCWLTRSRGAPVRIQQRRLPDTQDARCQLPGAQCAG